MALIAHWPLINNLEDYSGNDKHAYANGSLTTESNGVFGTAYRTQGGRIESGLSDFNHDWTIAGWWKMNGSSWGYSVAFAGTRSSTNGWMLYRNSGDTSGYLRWYMHYNTTGGSVSGYRVWPGVSGLQLNRWYHIVITRDMQGNSRIYLDGVLHSNSTRPSDFASWRLGNELEILGGGSNGWANSYVSGNDFRMYDHILTEKEIKLLYRAKFAHYHFNDGLQPGLLYSWYTIPSGHPTTEAGLDLLFREESSGTLGGTGVHYDVISWGNGQQSGSGVKPSYLPDSYFAWVVEGYLYLPKTGTYYFGIDGDDAIDIQITPQGTAAGQIKAYWYNGHGFSGTYTTGSGQVSLTYSGTAGEVVQFRARMEENGGGDGIKAAWKKPGDADYELIPKQYFYHLPTPIDSSGFNNHGIAQVNDKPLYMFEDTPIGKGYYRFFAGQQKRLKLPGLGLYNKTVSMWVRIRSGSSSNAESIMVYNDGVITGSGDTNQILLCMQGNVFKMHGWGSGDPGGTSSINDNQWHHLVWQMQHDPSTTSNRIMNMWVDGVKERANFNYSQGSFDPVSDSYWWVGYNARSYSTYTRDTNMDIANIEFYARFLNDTEVVALYNERASIDKEGFYPKQLNETKHTNLLLPYTTWTNGSTGSETYFGQNGSTSENSRVYADGPWGKTELVWRTTPSGDSGGDGGWNSSYFPIDINYAYRYSVWVRRYTTNSSGNFYLGLNPNPIRNDNGSSQGNPYFTCPGIGSLAYNQWYLVVGHIMPHYYSGGRHPESGYWTTDGTLSQINYCNLGEAEGRWSSSTTTARHRTYHYYSTITTAGLEFLYPRMDKIDGSEPSVAALLAGHDSRNYDLIDGADGGAIKTFVAKDQTNGIDVSELGVTRGLVAYWPFNGNALDYSTNQYHGTISGTSYVHDTEMHGIRFTAQSHYVDFNSPRIYLPREKSLSFFIRSNRPLSTQDNWEIGFLNQGSTQGSMFGMMYGVGSAQDLGFWGYGSAYDMSVGAVNNKWSSDGQWHHCLITMDGDRLVRVYVDGQQQNWLLHSNYSSTSPTVTMPIDTTNYFLINSRATWNSGFSYVDVAHVKLFDKALTEAEANIEYNVFKNKVVKITKGNQVFINGKLKEV